MRARRALLVLACASLVVRDAYADEPPAKQTLLLVQTLGTDGMDKDLSFLAQDLTEELVVSAASVSKPNGVRVQSEAELRLVARHLKEMNDVRPEDCKKLEACLAQMFEGEADQVLRGTLGRLGDTWVVTLKLIDVRTYEVVRVQSFAAETTEELIEALKPATAAVLGYAIAAPRSVEIAIPSDGRKIGVVPISGSGADKRNADMLGEMLGVLVRDLGFSALTRGDLISMINYATDRHSMAGTSLTEAIMEIAQASGVSLLVTGHVGRIEKTHLISLKMIDLERGEVTNRVLESFLGEESDLGAAMKFACARLFGRAPSGEGGPVSVVTDVEGEYRIDQGRGEVLPQAIAKIGLTAGKHQLNVTSEGYYPYYSDIYLFEREPLRVRPMLEPIREWYESPIVWSVAGIVVAGTATAIVIAVVPGGSAVDSASN